MQKTKMIFTLGPASETKETIKELINIGMNVARLNCSHGTHETHKDKIDIIKSLRDELNRQVGILLDIKGPKIRVDKFENDEALLKPGDEFIFSCEDTFIGNNKTCSISYKELYKDVKTSNYLLVDDGLLEFQITKVEEKKIYTKVITGGLIKNNKGVNAPYVDINLPAITDKDIDDLIFACNMNADFIAASFIRRASDILEIKNILKSHGGENIKVIAKIENQQGVNNIDSIIDVSDGIMVARGDLGTELPIEKVPIIQKEIIKKCNRNGKFVITATQMLDSMIRNPKPTRAEACDICNAIFDGTDAIMLSGESASGSYPLEAASTMSKIALESEANLNYEFILNNLRSNCLESYSEAISYSAVKAALKLTTKAIVVATETGATARLISKYRPKVPVIAITPSEEVMRGLSLNFGIIAKKCDYFNTTDEILKEAKKIALTVENLKEGDTILIAAGMPTSHVGGTNMLKIETI